MFPLSCPRRPHAILSLKDRQLHLRRASSQSRYTLSVAPLPLRPPPAHTFSAPVLLIRHNLPPAPFFHLYLPCLFPKFHSPIILPFFLSLLYHSSLRTPHYPLSAFLILSPISHCLFLPNLPLFFLLPLCISSCHLPTSTFFSFFCI